MKSSFIFLTILAFLTLVSCNQGNDTEIMGLECDKLKNFEDVQNIMTATSRESLTSLELAKQNIIGEWGLIGVQPAWTALEPGAECLHLTISESTVVIKDLNSGKESIIDYEITPFEVNNYSRFFLSTNDEVGINQVGMSEFSENYMFGSGKFPDGHIYIYEKL